MSSIRHHVSSNMFKPLTVYSDNEQASNAKLETVETTMGHIS